MVLVLDDMCNSNEITVKGIMQEMVERMEKMKLAVYPPEEDRRADPAMFRKWARWGLYDYYARTKPPPVCYAVAFDPEGFKRASEDLVADNDIHLRLHSWFAEPILEDDRITGVMCETKEGRQAIRGNIVIDCTGDLDVASRAGAPFIGGSYFPDHRVPPRRRRHRQSRIVSSTKRPSNVSRVDKKAKELLGGSWDKWWLKTPLPGIVWCNCPHMRGYDGAKVEDMTKAQAEGRKRIDATFAFVRENWPGFEKSYIVDLAPQIGVRQTRLLEGEYVVTKEDVHERVHFPDSVARGRDYYTPYRALVPKKRRAAPRRRASLLGDIDRAKNVARDPALHGDGRSGRRRGRDGARHRDVRPRRGCADAPEKASRARRGSWRRPFGERDPPPPPPPPPPPRGREIVSQPLEGIRILDLTQVMLGPCATQLLGDFGADVIKIERPGQGDLSRWSVPDPAGLDNPVFVSLNRNKRSIALNLKSEKAREIVRELAKDADVIVNNFRPGVMERMGLDYDDARGHQSAHHLRVRHRIRPKRPLRSQRRPRRARPSDDGCHGAERPIRSTRSPSTPRRSPTTRPPCTSCKASCSRSSTASKTGKGQEVDVSLYDSMLSMQTQEASMWMMRREG